MVGTRHLIIGGISNYGWDEVKHWVTSIKMSGYDEKIVLVATNITAGTVEKLVKEGVELHLYGERDNDGNYRSNTNIPPHVLRMFYIWDYLNKNTVKYDFVITTDVRDVVFQSDPRVWLRNFRDTAMIASCEMLKYEDEPWNNQNLLEAFGPFFHEQYKSMLIYNVGVLAGEIDYLKDLLFLIFQMSMNRPIPVVDQVVYNVLLRQRFIWDKTMVTMNGDAWAVQLGTTEEAINSGAGDLGAMVRGNPEALEEYRKHYIDLGQPRLDEEGYVVNNQGDRFVIVHQYDRTKAWTKKIIERYDDGCITISSK